MPSGAPSVDDPQFDAISRRARSQRRCAGRAPHARCARWPPTLPPVPPAHRFAPLPPAIRLHSSTPVSYMCLRRQNSARSTPNRSHRKPSTHRSIQLLYLAPFALLALFFFRPHLVQTVSKRFTTPAPTMTAFRDVQKVVIAREQSEGVGARVRRSIGSAELRNFDPFLLLDEFNVTQPAGFPDHPHRGMQTVTYMLEGAFRHEDNKGHAGTIGVGDLQWMTAGRGIVHSEMPATDGSNIGLQLWVNLAAKHKMTKPQYQELLAEDVPLAKSEDGSIEVNVIAGKCFNVESKVFTQTPTLYWDVRMLKGATFEEQIPEHYNAFIYVLEGNVTTGKKNVQGEHGSCIVFGPGEAVQVKSDDEARFVVLAGQPLNEPIVQHGPFVMNTQEQIMQAFRDFSAGKF